MKRIIVSLLIASFFVLPTIIQANEDNMTEVGYSVRAILPENQQKDVTYFDIEIEPGQQQQLELVISNTSEQDIDVLVETHSGVTNINGLIVYDGSEEAKTQSDMPSIEDVSEMVESVVTVPANGEASAFIDVTAPEQPFDGRLLGGVHFSIARDDDNASGSGVQSAFAYVIGLNITSSQGSNDIEPDLTFNGLTPEIYFGETRLVVNFSNIQPVMLPNVDIRAKVFEKADLETPVAEYEHQGFYIAPTFDFPLPIDIEGEPLEAGEYVLDLTLENESYHFEFEESFTISDSESD